ncbi:MAG: phosphoribosylglycinamide formyltransferase [Clostridia bacterium]
MLRMGVLVSGGGTNLQAILDKLKAGQIRNCEIAVVVSSKAGVKALERATLAGIPTAVVSKSEFESDFDQALRNTLDAFQVDFIVLAGFMSILSVAFIKHYPNKIINVHPALIPSFCGKGYYGLKPHEAALAYGVKVTGATVHFVTEGADEGPIILQKPVPVLEGDTPETLQLRVMQEAEWEILPQAIDLFCAGKLQVEGRVVHLL